jgi:hypothetical protein
MAASAGTANAASAMVPVGAVGTVSSPPTSSATVSSSRST